MLKRLPPTLLLLPILAGCASIGTQPGDPREYYVERRADAISSLHLSPQSAQVLRMEGLIPAQCEDAPLDCDQRIAHAKLLTADQALGTRAELNWLAAYRRDQARTEKAREPDLALVEAYLDTAQLAHAWLFLVDRPLAVRAFEDRQGQIRDIYNFATQRAMNLIFRHATAVERAGSMQLSRWKVERDPLHLHTRPGGGDVEELVAASTLRFKGLRNTYRRDGFGAELVGVRPAHPGASERFSEIRFFSTAAIMRFPEGPLDEALARKHAVLSVYDPTETQSVTLGGMSIPLAGNFTAPYGLWLTRSDFQHEALRMLLRGEGPQGAHVFMLQPYDPDRITVVMIHGLASSPATWFNLANEVLGDENLRQRYQIWQVRYPTNLPIPISLYEIRSALDEALKTLDPSDCAQATRDMVVVGHSMGGVIARLMVSKSSPQVWNAFVKQDSAGDAEKDRILHAELDRYLRFEPEPAIGRAVFMAAPHRGSPRATGFLGGLARRLVHLPGDLAEQTRALMQETGPLLKPSLSADRLTSINSLSDKDPFLLAASTSMPPTAGVPFHSIIGRENLDGPLADASDGFVPYRSAHLDGAESELVVESGHSVQERAAAILELRRILHLHEAKLRDRPAPACAGPDAAQAAEG